MSAGWVLIGLLVILFVSFWFALWVSRWVEPTDEYDRAVDECETPGECPATIEPESPEKFRSKWGIGEK